MNPSVTIPLEIDSVALVHRYFQTLSSHQLSLLEQLGDLYTYWNARINLISRKDIARLYGHHVLHALAIAKVSSFCPHTRLLDLGTGGGFPGIPLAILFPEATFHLVDSVEKKTKVVRLIAAALGLQNVQVSCTRGEQVTEQYDFVLGRGVANLALFYSWVQNKISPLSKNSLQNGILYLKGTDSVQVPALSIHTYPIQDFFQEPFFSGKCVVHAHPTG
ncbi:MAG TPA: 16S rRNA (guanine(527)-N(7))-methyltransferase RsmG [Amoebophilaceae bacterium]|jgi:16S rRNA (guanine527-N7)-methyltransferase|nr:16S rRNA (guanine(527)-N(7))-methyltransferase RsmG [Amoebophilaceae bacterium]